MTNDDLLIGPGEKAYAAATKPHNTVLEQHPAFVARPQSVADMSAVVQECQRRGLTAVPQATGHGAGMSIGSDMVVVDTSGLADVRIDAQARSARVGAGVTWGTVNAEAEKHGLLGLAGTSPSVSVSGYTFGGGMGWLIRPHGLAAGSLRRVEYVDGDGTVRTASDDASDELDRDAMFAFRGGGGVGVATALEFDLVAPADLHAGYLLWQIDALDDVVAAWAKAMDSIGDDVATSFVVLHAPPGPPFPDELQGKPTVFLSLAAGEGPAGAQPLLDAVRAAAAPAADTWGSADAAKLGQVHLDPPPGTPAIGQGRWLDDTAPGLVGAALAVAAPQDSPLNMVEVRNVGNPATGLPGAESTVPGPYLVHDVASPPADEAARKAVDQAFSQVRAAVAPAEVGRSVGTFVEGAASVPDALPVETRERIIAIADRVDPKGNIARSRFII